MAHIPLEMLERMFANIRTETNWHVDGDMLWGYFFTDPDPTKLERAAEALGQSGYRVVEIYETDDKCTHLLHVERIETHTPETLDARNSEFSALAADFDLERYDGMDVGPVPDLPNGC
jgi:hypothetical protein